MTPWGDSAWIKAEADTLWDDSTTCLTRDKFRNSKISLKIPSHHLLGAPDKVACLSSISIAFGGCNHSLDEENG